MTSGELRALSVTGRLALDTITRNTGDAVLTAWNVTMTSADDGALEAWLSRSVPVVQAGQRIASRSQARATWGLLERSDGITGSPGPFVPELVTAETAWQTSPVLRLRALLADGLPWLVAKSDSGAYAQNLASGDLGSAARQGAQHAANRAAAQIGSPVAWRKVPAPDCCPWCQRLQNRLFHDATTVAMHLADHCGIQAVTRNTPGFDRFSNSRTIFD